MATTPKQFFSKNLKWFFLIVVILLVFKSVQGCNRNMGTSIKEKQYTHIIDSLDTRYNEYYSKTQDSIKKLNFELELANEQAKSADQRANAVQSAVEKIKSNTTTTVVVKGAEEVKDTTKNK
jgi:hypothetical protein